MTKKCFKCSQLLPISEFYKHGQMKDGYVNKCKTCNKKDVQQNYQVNKDYYKAYEVNRQRTSFSRIFRHRYSGMLARVQGRATRRYDVEGTEIMTQAEFLNWCDENMETFNFLYSQWAKSNYSNRLSPSIDRVNNGLGYILSNIRWVSKSENSSKYTNDKKDN